MGECFELLSSDASGDGDVLGCWLNADRRSSAETDRSAVFVAQCRRRMQFTRLIEDSIEHDELQQAMWPPIRVSGDNQGSFCP